jgi:hypothetical protein
MSQRVVVLTDDERSIALMLADALRCTAFSEIDSVGWTVYHTCLVDLAMGRKPHDLEAVCIRLLDTGWQITAAADADGRNGYYGSAPDDAGRLDEVGRLWCGSAYRDRESA